MTFPLCEKLGIPTYDGFYYGRYVRLEDLEKVLEQAKYVHSYGEMNLWYRDGFGGGQESTHTARIILIEEIKPKDTAESLLREIVSTLGVNAERRIDLLEKARKFLEGVK